MIITEDGLIETTFGAGILACAKIERGAKIEDVCPDIEDILAAYPFALIGSDTAKALEKKAEEWTRKRLPSTLIVYLRSPIGSDLKRLMFDQCRMLSKCTADRCKLLEACRDKEDLDKVWNDIQEVVNTTTGWSNVREALARNGMRLDHSAAVQMMVKLAATPEDWSMTLPWLDYGSQDYQTALNFIYGAIAKDQQD